MICTYTSLQVQVNKPHYYCYHRHHYYVQLRQLIEGFGCNNYLLDTKTYMLTKTGFYFDQHEAVKSHPGCDPFSGLSSPGEG